eukprot:2521347-Prymnesium_polylepis.1
MEPCAIYPQHAWKAQKVRNCRAPAERSDRVQHHRSSQRQSRARRTFGDGCHPLRPPAAHDCARRGRALE